VVPGDNTYCRIKKEDVFKGKPGKPTVEGKTFGWVIHGGDRRIAQFERIRSRRLIWEVEVHP